MNPLQTPMHSEHDEFNLVHMPRIEWRNDPPPAHDDSTPHSDRSYKLTRHPALASK